jgi:hypothetical protein
VVVNVVAGGDPMKISQVLREGMQAVEFAAEEQAIKDVRQRWLPVLEAYAEKHGAALDPEERSHLDWEIRRLRDTSDPL